MEFNGKPWNSPNWGDKFQGIPCNFESFSYSIEYSMEFHGSLVTPNRISRTSVKFHENLEIYNFHCHQVLLNFHGIFDEIPWNSWDDKSDVIKFHVIPWNLVIANSYDIRFPGTSMEFLLQKSMELWIRHIKYHKSFMEFHGTRTALFQITPGFYGIPWKHNPVIICLGCFGVKYRFILKDLCL